MSSLQRGSVTQALCINIKSHNLVIDEFIHRKTLPQVLETSNRDGEGLARFTSFNSASDLFTTSIFDIMSDSDDVYDSDSAKYDIHDPRTSEHEAYKIAQDNAGRAGRRYRYGADVDADGTNHNAREENNDDSMELRLQNAREARGWALE